MIIKSEFVIGLRMSGCSHSTKHNPIILPYTRVYAHQKITKEVAQFETPAENPYYSYSLNRLCGVGRKTNEKNKQQHK